MNMHTPVPDGRIDPNLRRRLDLENAIANQEGDALLLDLALNDVFRSIDRTASTHTINITGDQLKALEHAANRLFHGSRETAELFFAEDEA